MDTLFMGSWEPLYRRSMYGSYPFRLVRGENATVYDDRGRAYVDLCGGWGAVGCGHGNPVVNGRISEQMGRLVAPMYFETEVQEAALRAVDGMLPAGLQTVALYSTGSEAVEFALRLARRATGRRKFLSFQGHFHGKTHGAMYLLGHVPEVYGPRPEGYVEVVALDEACLAGPDALAARLEACGGEFAGVLYEPVLGYSGPMALPAWFQRVLRAFCTARGALLVADEVFTSCFRCGQWFESSEATPDVIVFGKGLGNGYPVAGVAATRRVAEGLLDTLPGSTFAGNCLAWAAVLGVVEVLSNERNLGERVAGFEAIFREKVAAAFQGEPVVRAAGKGALLGLRLGAPWEGRFQNVFNALLERGVIVHQSPVGYRFTPPLTISVAEWSGAVDVVVEVLKGEAEKCLHTAC